MTENNNGEFSSSEMADAHLMFVHLDLKSFNAKVLFQDDFPHRVLPCQKVSLLFIAISVKQEVSS